MPVSWLDEQLGDATKPKVRDLLTQIKNLITECNQKLIDLEAERVPCEDNDVGHGVHEEAQKHGTDTGAGRRGPSYGEVLTTRANLATVRTTLIASVNLLNHGGGGIGSSGSTDRGATASPPRSDAEQGRSSKGPPPPASRPPPKK